MKPPQVIYLQWEEPPDGEVTWCIDKINDNDDTYFNGSLLKEFYHTFEVNPLTGDRSVIARLKTLIDRYDL